MYKSEQELKDILTQNNNEPILSGEDYDRGQLEEINYTCTLNSKILTMILKILIDKKLVSIETVISELQTINF